MRFALIAHRWVIVAVALIIVSAAASLLLSWPSAMERNEELRECARTVGTPQYDIEVCGEM